MGKGCLEEKTCMEIPRRGLCCGDRETTREVQSPRSWENLWWERTALLLQQSENYDVLYPEKEDTCVGRWWGWLIYLITKYSLEVGTGKFSLELLPPSSARWETGPLRSENERELRLNGRGSCSYLKIKQGFALLKYYIHFLCVSVCVQFGVGPCIQPKPACPWLRRMRQRVSASQDASS